MEWECENIFEGEDFAQHVRYDIGDDTKVLFGYDVWCGESPLKLVYPALFNIACNKDAWVKEYMERPNDTLHWNVRFIWPMHDWELKGVSCFFALLYSQKIRFGGETYNSISVYQNNWKCFKKSRINFVGFCPKEILLK
jgi:hypothetical protein